MTTAQIGFYFDSSSCSGCKACQIACKDKNNLEPGLNWRRVHEISGGRWQQQGNAWKHSLFVYNLSLACNHCEQPICEEVCPTRSITKQPNGIVTVRSETCVGCHYCSWACPYDAPQFGETKRTMSKCNLCSDEIETGRPPACVAVCGMRALDFGTMEELRSRYGLQTQCYPLPAEALTHPSLVITPHQHAHRSLEEPASITNQEENP